MSGAVPELRFPGFAGGWDHRTLGDFMAFKNGVNAEKDQYGSGTKFINVMDIIAEGPITHDKIIGRVEVSDRELAVNEVRYGDILFQRSSETREEVGQSNVYLDSAQTATFGGFVIRGRPITEFNPRFFNRLLRTDNVRSDMTSRSGGSTRYNIGQESLALVPVVVPPTLPEQEKIASFLDAVDGKISKMREKADGLRQFKTGLMQRLFSQELRFTRENGSEFPEWEERKLGDLVGWVRTNSLSREHLTDDDASGVQNIHYGDIHSKFRAIFRQSNEEVPFITTSAPLRAISDEDFVRPGDLVIADASEDYADIGKAVEVMEVREHSMIAGLHTFIARPKKGVLAPGFAGYLLRSASIRRQIVRAAQGVSVLGLSKGNLEKLTLSLPVLEEQEKIGSALMAVDTKIDVVMDQIAYMESFRKGLLQKMFV